MNAGARQQPGKQYGVIFELIDLKVGGSVGGVWCGGCCLLTVALNSWRWPAREYRPKWNVSSWLSSSAVPHPARTNRLPIFYQP
jgi:hypothetical protein